MKPRMLIVGVLALVCGLSAVVLVNSLRQPGGQAIERAEVVYAAADVKPGETVAEAMLEIRKVPVEEIPEDAIRKFSEAVERAALGQIDKGDMLRQKKLAERGAGRGMAALIKPGMRAFTIQTPTFSSSLAGFLLPGYKVDVLLTNSSNGGADDETGGAVTTTLLQNVEILAIHTVVNAPTANKINPEDARSITLMVTPEDAEKLDLGQNKGTLHLSLRNQKDDEHSNAKPTMLSDLQLRQVKAKPVVVAAEPAPAPTPTAPPAPPPPPEPVVVRMPIRTLRGTLVGADVLTVVEPARPPGSKPVVPWPPAGGSSTSATIAGPAGPVLGQFR